MKTPWNQLERDTAAYFENLSREALCEELELGKALADIPTPDPDKAED